MVLALAGDSTTTSACAERPFFLPLGASSSGSSSRRPRPDPRRRPRPGRPSWPSLPLATLAAGLALATASFLPWPPPCGAPAWRLSALLPSASAFGLAFDLGLRLGLGGLRGLGDRLGRVLLLLASGHGSPRRRRQAPAGSSLRSRPGRAVPSPRASGSPSRRASPSALSGACASAASTRRSWPPPGRSSCRAGAGRPASSARTLSGPASSCTGAPERRPSSRSVPGDPGGGHHRPAQAPRLGGGAQRARAPGGLDHDHHVGQRGDDPVACRELPRPAR